jgi:hypothetical protein
MARKCWKKDRNGVRNHSFLKRTVQELHDTSDFFIGNSVSQMATFFPSLFCPAVATKLHDPRNTKSQSVLVWHRFDCCKKKNKEKINKNTQNREELATYIKCTITLRRQSNLPQRQFTFSIRYTKLIAMRWKTTTCHLQKWSGSTWCTDDLLVTPFPHLDGTICATSQI